MTSPSPSRWPRLALLATVVAMAATLLGTGFAAWRSARTAYDEVISAQGFNVSRTLRRDLRRAEGLDEAFEEALAELEDQGLRYLAVVRSDGRLVGSAGVPSVPEEELTALVAEVELGVPVRVGDRIRIVQGRGGRSQARPRPMEGRSRGERSRRRGRLFVVEFEPVVASTMVGRATTTMVTSSVAAAVLLLVALLLWRAAAQAERVAAQLQKDRHLAALGEMSAVLGHEIRNPLASLKGNAQLTVERLPEDHKARKGAERVVREAVRLEQLTAQVLAFARSGSLERIPTDPLELARGAIADLDRVDLEAPDALPAWSLDAERMRQVLANVARNAVQATPEPERVSLAVRVELDQLVFEVRDRGPGIEPGDEEKLFEPFFTRRVQGTGLGLAVARRIVEGHGGTIAARNHADGGAVFSIAVPGEV